MKKNHKDVSFPISTKKNIDKYIKTLLHNLWTNGYVKIGNVITPNEAQLIKKRFDKVLSNPVSSKHRWTKYSAFEYFLPPFGDETSVMWSNIAGRDKDVDKILNKIFIHKVIKYLLKMTLGEHYKAWEISIRRSLKNDNGLSIHQDAYGEMGISVLLNDHFEKIGTTSVIPKSHRFSTSCRESGAETYIKPSIMKFFTEPLIGNAGDLFLFFKHTWHGRVKGTTNKNSDCLLMGLFGSGYKFKPFQLSSKKAKIIPEELSNLVCSDHGLKPLGDDLYEVKGKNSEKRLIDCVYNKNFQNSSRWDYLAKSKPLLDTTRSILKSILLRN